MFSLLPHRPGPTHSPGRWYLRGSREVTSARGGGRVVRHPVCSARCRLFVGLSSFSFFFSFVFFSALVPDFSCVWRTFFPLLGNGTPPPTPSSPGWASLGVADAIVYAEKCADTAAISADAPVNYSKFERKNVCKHFVYPQHSGLCVLRGSAILAVFQGLL